MKPDDKVIRVTLSYYRNGTCDRRVWVADDVALESRNALITGVISAALTRFTWEKPITLKQRPPAKKRYFYKGKFTKLRVVG